MTRSSCSRVSLELPLNRWTEAAIRDSVEQFILGYLRIQPVSAEDYNARRTHPSRGWYAIARTSRLNAMSVYAEKT